MKYHEQMILSTEDIKTLLLNDTTSSLDRIHNLEEDKKELPSSEQKSLLSGHDRCKVRGPVIEKDKRDITEMSLSEQRKRPRDLNYMIEVIGRIMEKNRYLGMALLTAMLTGARRNELPGIEMWETPNDITLNIPTLKQKTGKLEHRSLTYPKTSPGGIILRDIIKEYGKNLHDDSDPMYSSTKPFFALNTQALAAALREFRDPSDTYLTLHSFRHYFTSELRSMAINKNNIKKALGHKKSSSTDGYGSDGAAHGVIPHMVSY